jgi:ribonuclease HII
MIIAADEVGRGSLAGPLVVGAVMVPEGMERISGVNDSKKMSPEVRQRLSSLLHHMPEIEISTSWVPASDVDRDGITVALRHAFLVSVKDLLNRLSSPTRVREIRIDGSPMSGIGFGDIPVKFIVQGDALDWRIGAASIIAKVARDAWMVEQHPLYPQYHWDRNKGYGSKDHTEAIRLHGLTPLHRATFCKRFVPEESFLDWFK